MSLFHLNTQGRQYIEQKLLEDFALSSKQSEYFMTLLETALNGNSAPLFYSIRFEIARTHKDTFFVQVFNTIFTIYIYLRDQSRDQKHKEQYDLFFKEFYLHIVHEQCLESIQAEKRHEIIKSALKHISDRLSETLQVQQLMIANISHEMRTALNAILGYQKALKNSPENFTHQQIEYLQKAMDASSSLKGLVSDILDISKINAGQMELKETPFWLDDVILSSVNSVIRNAEEKELNFNIDIDLFTQELIGDSKRIQEIITNLLSNAIKYTDKGNIDFIVKKEVLYPDKHTIVFKVIDSGIGMSQTQIDTIFAPYIRYAPQRQGVGLGLHIAQKLAHKMGGTLFVKSTENRGSTFIFTLSLPYVASHPIDMRHFSVCFYNDTKKKKKQQHYFEQLKITLESYGAKVDIINNEKQLLNQLLDTDQPAPSVIVVTTNENRYTHFDAMVHYLKSLKKFRSTQFIANQIKDRNLLHFFDKGCNTHVPLYSYIDLASELSKREDSKAVDNSQKMKILIVDDIETNLDVAKLFLNMLYPNAILNFAAGGYEAIGMYKVNNYDIILLDLKMPGLNGYEVLEKLRIIKALPPIFALTADVYQDTFEKVMDAGFNGMLEKPIQPDILEKTIQRTLNEQTI